MAKNKTEKNKRVPEKCTDGETLRIIKRVQGGDEYAFTLLSEKYRGVAESAAVSTLAKLTDMGQSTMGMDDLKQEASLSLYKAALGYDASMADKVTFGLYAKICIRNAMISLLRRENSKRRKRIRAEEKGIVPDHSSRFAELEAAGEILRLSRDALSEYESAVLDEYISGKTAREIAKDMGETPKSVSNAIYRIKVKLRRAAESLSSSGK